MKKAKPHSLSYKGAPTQSCKRRLVACEHSHDDRTPRCEQKLEKIALIMTRAILKVQSANVKKKITHFSLCPLFHDTTLFCSILVPLLQFLKPVLYLIQPAPLSLNSAVVQVSYFFSGLFYFISILIRLFPWPFSFSVRFFLLRQPYGLKKQKTPTANFLFSLFRCPTTLLCSIDQPCCCSTSLLWSVVLSASQSHNPALFHCPAMVVNLSAVVCGSVCLTVPQPFSVPLSSHGSVTPLCCGLWFSLLHCPTTLLCSIAQPCCCSTSLLWSVVLSASLSHNPSLFH